MARIPVAAQGVAMGVHKPARDRQNVMAIGEALERSRPFDSDVLRGSCGCDGGARRFSRTVSNTVHNIGDAITTDCVPVVRDSVQSAD
jgi:hypothetical protein